MLKSAQNRLIWWRREYQGTSLETFCTDWLWYATVRGGSKGGALGADATPFLDDVIFLYICINVIFCCLYYCCTFIEKTSSIHSMCVPPSRPGILWWRQKVHALAKASPLWSAGSAPKQILYFFKSQRSLWCKWNFDWIN